MTLEGGTKELFLRIRDNGKGMDASVLASAFARYEAPRDISDPEAGSGMGLAVARKIAVMHRGSMVIESRPNVGTAVTVRLPLCQPESGMVRESGTQYKGVMTDFLTELSDVLDYKYYLPE